MEKFHEKNCCETSEDTVHTIPIPTLFQVLTILLPINLTKKTSSRNNNKKYQFIKKKKLRERKSL